ncbi:hypothetical protein ACLQ3K_25690 [Tsukamurella sp. DT100]|uniref:hypothetical protein n=1 Tax=Tsukamurella sp. DT100 TaxID=3393415 RepID=UPI003CE977C8
MSTRIARRDRRNHEHGHEWVDTEREHLRFIAARQRVLAIADGRLKVSKRVRRQGASYHIAPGLPWLSIIPEVKGFRADIERRLAGVKITREESAA